MSWSVWLSDAFDRQTFYRDLIENFNWTPVQIANEITIPQLAVLWMNATGRKDLPSTVGDPFAPGPGEKVGQVITKDSTERLRIKGKR